jgi:uncharacterized protein (TIGR02001 family)
MTIRKSALATAALLIASTAQADFSANLGWASDYYFRGILQKTSSPSAGIDYTSENGSFYAGTWAADVAGPFGDGLEVDGYFGYNNSIGELGYGIGYTGYFYTGDFDDTYQEINLSVAYGWLSLDAAIGEYENFAGPTQNYQFYKATVSHNGFYGAYGTFQDEFDGDYFEVGYGTTVSDIDLGIYLLVSDEKLGLGDDQEALVFTIGKTFDLN